MHAKKYLIISALILVLMMPFFSSTTAQDEATIEINMLGEEPQTRFGDPVIVAGLWHIVKITFEQQNFQTITLKFYNGDSIPSTEDQDESNYYEWKYDKTTQEWTEVSEYEYTYINLTNSQVTGNSYSFCVGVKDTLPDIVRFTQNWTLDVYADGGKVSSKNIVVEKPSLGLAKMHHDVVTFRVEPFTEETIAKDDPSLDEYFIIGNPGNVPLDITVNYGSYNEIIDIANSGDKLPPDGKFNHFVTLNSQSWKPGFLSIAGIVQGAIPENLMITTGTFSFETSHTIDAADIEISVGRSDYTIQLIPGSNIVFQYEESLEMYEGQKRDLKVYISGEGTANLDVWADEINVEILSISGRDQTGAPLTITSTNDSEYAVTIRVEAIRENKVGEITYELEIDGKYYTYTTEITIGPPREEDSEAINLPASSILIGFVIIIVAGYMISTQIRHRRK